VGGLAVTDCLEIFALENSTPSAWVVIARQVDQMPDVVDAHLARLFGNPDGHVACLGNPVLSANGHGSDASVSEVAAFHA